MSKGKKAELWQRYSRRRDEATRREIVLAYLDLVKNLSNRLPVHLPSCLSREDLENCGIIGLMEAIDKFDPQLGIEFEVFAYRRIRGAMYDEIRKANWIPRSTWQKLNRLQAAREKMENSLGRGITDAELAEETGTSVAEIHALHNHLSRLAALPLEDYPPEDGDQEGMRLVEVVPDPASPDPLQRVCEKEDRVTLTEAIKQLEERDRLVLALYYQEGLNLKEIGEVLEVSESRVCQLHGRAMARLKKIIAQMYGE